MQAVSSVLAGYQESLLPEVDRYWLSNRPEPTPEPPKRKRYQVGSIEHRWGNKNRKKPSLSLYYCYYASEHELHGEGSTANRKKQRIYLQTHQCHEIGKMVREKRPYTEILQAIARTKHHRSKPHHTQEPKI